MKHFMLPFLAGIVIACTPSKSDAQQQAKETIQKEFAAPRSGVVAVYNIHGPVKVEGYNGDKVVIEVHKIISAKETSVLEEGKKELQVRFSEEGDSLVAYIAEPFDSRPNRSKNRNIHIDYSFELEYHLKVPARLNVVAHTVNKGDIEVSDVSGNLSLINVNGNVKVLHARGLSNFRTINGDVTADYPGLPPENSSYYTLNGNIRISYPADLSADVRFKSFQGDFFTDFPETEVLPAQAEKNQDRKGDKTVYRLSKNSSIRIGKGGRGLRFETFNGNVYLKKQTL